MKKSKISAIFIGLILFCGCSSGETAQGEYTFSNSGFESGTSESWTATGEAFSHGVSRLSVGDGGESFYQAGKYFLYGKAAGEEKTGTLTSETFKLVGNGKIGFLIGGGADSEKCYVALCDESGNELVRRGNTSFGTEKFHDGMYRAILDGSEYIGKKVCIKVVDNDSGSDGYHYLNVDDFIVNYQGEEERAGAPLAADKYIVRNMAAVDKTYRHTYHAMPPVGWMNDPNGFNYAFGKIHVFYQFHPYSAAWGPMHWGHYTSEDFVKWTLEPTAIAPDTDYDRDGCFSGTSIVKDGRLYLMYTSVAGGRQTQALARSTDGKTFTKAGKVIGSEELPPDCSWADFRDPKVFQKDGMYYAMMGGRGTKNTGMLLLYRSENLMSWEYVGKVFEDNRTGGVYECPDYVTVDGKEILLTSPQRFARQDWRHENVHTAIYMVGNLNTSTGAFTPEYEDEIDSGLDFYAPQTLTMPDGRVVMTAWMQMWTRSMPTAEHGWAGAMILPRELSLKDGKLYQSPVREIENYRQNRKVYENQTLDGEKAFDGVEGTKVELNFTLDLGTAARTGVKVYKGTAHETRIYYDKETGLVVFDRSDMGKILTYDTAERDAAIRHVKAEIKDNRLEMRIFLDVSSVEVFLNGGERTMTGNVYSDPTDTGISFFAEGGTAKLVSLEKFDITVE